MLSHYKKSFRNILDILLTGGVGDFIAMESFFSEYEEKSIRHVFYATRAQKEISTLFDALPNYNIEKHITCFDRFNVKLPYLKSIEDLHRFTKIRLPGVSDYSIIKKFKDIRNNQYKNHNSSFLKYELVKDIRNKFNLPPQYIVVQPCTRASYRKSQWRELPPHKWNFLLSNRLCQTGPLLQGRRLKVINPLGLPTLDHQKIVILNVEDCQIPYDKDIINLTNKTTLIESIEILKNANGYFGVNSALSVLAAKLFTRDRLYIHGKTKNMDVYYYPQNFN